MFRESDKKRTTKTPANITANAFAPFHAKDGHSVEKDILDILVAISISRKIRKEKIVIKRNIVHFCNSKLTLFKYSALLAGSISKSRNLRFLKLLFLAFRKLIHKATPFYVLNTSLTILRYSSILLLNILCWLSI